MEISLDSCEKYGTKQKVCLILLDGILRGISYLRKKDHLGIIIEKVPFLIWRIWFDRICSSSSCVYIQNSFLLSMKNAIPSLRSTSSSKLHGIETLVQKYLYLWKNCYYAHHYCYLEVSSCSFLNSKREHKDLKQKNGFFFKLIKIELINSQL